MQIRSDFPLNYKKSLTLIYNHCYHLGFILLSVYSLLWVCVHTIIDYYLKYILFWLHVVSEKMHLRIFICHPHFSLKVKVKFVQFCLTLCSPMDCPVHGILQARILELVAFPFSRGSSQPRDGTQESYIAGRFLTSWATGKPKNTEVGSLSLLQRIFLPQESNWGLLHGSQILYQLSYQGSPGLQNHCRWWQQPSN